MADTKNTQGEQSHPSKSQHHQLNITGAQEVEDFISAFETNQIGTCLKMLQKGEVLIVDANTMRNKMEELKILNDNYTLMESALAEANEDLSLIIDMSDKLTTVTQPIDDVIKPEIEKLKKSGKEEISIGGWMKILSKLPKVLHKQQKQFKKAFAEIDLDKVKALINKYTIRDHQEVTDTKELGEPTEQRQLPPVPPKDTSQ